MKLAPDALAILVALLAPSGWMVARYLAGAAAFPSTLAGWIVLEAAIQGWLLGLRLRQRLSLARFRQWQFGVGLVIGLPATILCVYLGALPEARLVAFLTLLLQRSGWAQAFYSLGLFAGGLLLFFPFFQGNASFLALELFRPLVGAIIVLGSAAVLRLSAEKGRQRLRSRLRTQRRSMGRT